MQSSEVPIDALSAFHRSGQTFITWPEVRPADLSITYRVYRQRAPIDAAHLDTADLLAELPQGSGVYWTEHARTPDNSVQIGGYESLHNYVITDLGPELPDGTGLFVWTTHEDGEFYYALRSSDGSLFASVGPISEQVSAPAPVLVWRSSNGLSRVYTQFMDYAAYNPTFDAPRAGNYYMGLPNWEALSQVRSQIYAYNYWLGLPVEEVCDGPPPDPAPLVLHIEGHGTRYGSLPFAPYFCAVHLWGDDPNQSWYFGFSATHDYSVEGPVRTGPIVNYSEARLLRAVHEVIALSDIPSIDVNRIYVYGHSMGGTGALMLAQRYPQIFAAASASEPMVNYAAAEMWLEELESKWGTRTLNLPVESRGADAAHLTRYDGTGVWDWQNLGAQLSARRGDEMAFISIAHGTQDTVIDWETVVRPCYAHFYAGARGFLGEIWTADHTWLSFREHPDWPFEAMVFRLDESFPALANASGSLPVPPDGVGGYNMSLEWSASWHDFAGPPVDTAGEWSVALRSMAGAQTVDVTPRRLQRFVVTPGEAYIWQNLSLDGDAVIQEGEVIADADGLVTVVGFKVSETGSRLVLREK